MSTARRAGAFGVLVVAMLAAACARTVTGSGPVVSRSFAVAPFKQITVAGPWDVSISHGPVNSLTIRADADVLPDLIEESSQDSLHLQVQPRVDIRDARIQATITAPVVSLVDASSSATVRLGGTLRSGELSLSVGGSSRVVGRVDTDRLTLTADDSSSISVSGSADEVHVDATSSSRIDAGGVRASTVEVHLDRDARANVWATAELEVDLSRDSRATYRGSPAVPERKISSGASLAAA